MGRPFLLAWRRLTSPVVWACLAAAWISRDPVVKANVSTGDSTAIRQQDAIT
jgi:hypothetical protein